MFTSQTTRPRQDMSSRCSARRTPIKSTCKLRFKCFVMAKNKPFSGCFLWWEKIMKKNFIKTTHLNSRTREVPVKHNCQYFLQYMSCMFFFCVHSTMQDASFSGIIQTPVMYTNKSSSTIALNSFWKYFFIKLRTRRGRNPYFELKTWCYLKTNSSLTFSHISDQQR